MLCRGPDTLTIYFGGGSILDYPLELIRCAPGMHMPAWLYPKVHIWSVVKH